jgi:hypothetical protein
MQSSRRLLVAAVCIGKETGCVPFGVNTPTSTPLSSGRKSASKVLRVIRSGWGAFHWAAVLALTILVHTAPASDVRFQIESMLREMASSCIAGDEPGYMRYVCTVDPEFLAEQRYFARDMAKKPAESCSLTIGELTVKDEEATAELTLTWNMPGAAVRSVTYDARFARSAVDPSGDDSGWRFAGETWAQHSDATARVLVMHDPHKDGLDALAVRVVQAFGEVRAHVEEGFMLSESQLPLRTQKIKLYGSMKHLQASICLSYVDGLSGWNEPGESVKLLSGPRTGLPALRSLLAHEYGHVATFELGPTSNKMPWWILEGAAELAAEKWGRKPDGVVKAWSAANRLAPWEEITDFETVKPKWRGHVYGQGHHMLGYISQTFGREKRVGWLKAMSNGVSLDAATTQVFGLTFEQLDNQWRADLPVTKTDEAEKVVPTVPDVDPVPAPGAEPVQPAGPRNAPEDPSKPNPLSHPAPKLRRVSSGDRATGGKVRSGARSGISRFRVQSQKALAVSAH